MPSLVNADFTLEGDYLVAEDVVLPQVAFREGCKSGLGWTCRLLHLNSTLARQVLVKPKNYYNEFYQVGQTQLMF